MIFLNKVIYKYFQKLSKTNPALKCGYLNASLRAGNCEARERLTRHLPRKQIRVLEHVSEMQSISEHAQKHLVSDTQKSPSYSKLKQVIVSEFVRAHSHLQDCEWRFLTYQKSKRFLELRKFDFRYLFKLTNIHFS